MNRFVIGCVLIGLFFSTGVFAQQRPYYTQYVLNNYALNPALSGIENYTDVKLSMRDQWVGLNGAPQSFYLTAHMPIGKSDFKTSATSFATPGYNPRGNAYWETYNASEPHHGIGMKLVQDKAGLYKRLNAQLTYAYHLGLSPVTNLAAGVGVGIQRIGFDRDKASLTSPVDPALNNPDIMKSKVGPDLSFGLWLYSRNYFVGASLQQIIPTTLKLGNTAGAEQVMHQFITAGYRLLLNEDINMLPSVMFRSTAGFVEKPQIDLNVKLQYHDLVWVGANYRFKEGYAAMVGLNLGNAVNVGYSYDITKTALGTVSRGTHELVIGFLIGNTFGDSCPRNVW